MKKLSLFFIIQLVLFVLITTGLSAQTFNLVVVDQTPTAPLANPNPNAFQPRYISGFGQGDSYTVFFEDRDNGSTISFNTTTTGPTGFAALSTATNISNEYHFCVKDWPININGTDYSYRAWAWAWVGNNAEHHFYVSNDLVNWTLISTFTIPNAAGFTNARGEAYYGFHDVFMVNGNYYALDESNGGQTMICKSANGDDDWEAIASIGGTELTDGNLIIPDSSTLGWTPSGSFIDLGHDRGFGWFYMSPDDDGLFLAINTVAKASMSPGDLESALINPANWTWNDGSTGPASNPLLSETPEHDLRECWVVPYINPDDEWVIMYDADFGSADGGKALGYTTAKPPAPPVPIPLSDWAIYVSLLLMMSFIGFRFFKG